MIRLLLDQGLPRTAAIHLRAVNWDVVHVQEIGLSRFSDVAIIEYARKNERCVCTLDADFHALLAVEGGQSPSVIRIRKEGLRGRDLAVLLIDSWPLISAAVASGAMVSIANEAIRIRRLPIVRSQIG